MRLVLYFIFVLGAYEIPLLLGRESPQMVSDVGPRIWRICLRGGSAVSELLIWAEKTCSGTRQEFRKTTVRFESLDDVLTTSATIWRHPIFRLNSENAGPKTPEIRSSETILRGHESKCP